MIWKIAFKCFQYASTAKLLLLFLMQALSQELLTTRWSLLETLSMFVPISKALNTESMGTRVNIIFLIIMGKDDWRSKTLKWIKARRSIRQILQTTWSDRQCTLVSSIPCHWKWNPKVTNPNPCHSWHVIVVQVNDNSAVSLSIRRLRHHSEPLWNDQSPFPHQPVQVAMRGSASLPLLLLYLVHNISNQEPCRLLRCCERGRSKVQSKSKIRMTYDDIIKQYQ